MHGLVNVADEYEALLQFLYLAPVGLAQASLDGEISMINPISAQLLMPLSRDGCLSNLFTALEDVAPDLRNLTVDFGQSHGMICDAKRIQVNVGVKGRSDPQFLSLSLLKLDDSRLMAVLSDISLQVKRERLLKQNEAWLNAVLTGITDYALVNLDSRGNIVDWNPSIERVTGLKSDAVVNRPFSIFYREDATTPERLADRLDEADRNGWSLEDGWHLKADGSRFWGSAMVAPLMQNSDSSDVEGANAIFARTPDEPAYCLVIRDITDKREAAEAHRQASSCDYLTGLSNRRAFFEAAELEMERWSRTPRDLSIILFDADHFKLVNDTYGHPAGDAVLRHFANILSATFRAVDIVARVGGEEFAVLLPSTSADDAAAIADRVRQVLASQAIDFDGSLIRYTVSGGVASMDENVRGFDGLMKRVDEALYDAKRSGRNRIASWTAPKSLPQPRLVA